MLEKPWQELVERIAGTYRWTWFHLPAFRPTTNYAPAGYPDLTLVKGSRLVFAELKQTSLKAKPTQAQVNWLRQLEATGAEVALWRPEDLDEVTAVLSGKRPASLPPDFPVYKPLTPKLRRR